MPYAVLQTELSPPGLDQLQRAFRFVPGLTPGDAHILGKDAFGILVKNFSEEQAGSLQGALRAEGVETEVVDQSRLPEVPPKKIVTRLDCLPERLLIYDPLGRSFALDWRHVMFVAAGAVRLTEFVRRQQAGPPVGDQGDWRDRFEVEYETVTREEQRFHLLADIIITGAVLRYSVTAEKFHFDYLGERDLGNKVANFSLLVRDLVRHGSNARLNRGAEAINADATKVLSYPSKNAFYEEMVWMLWQMKKAT